MSGGHVIVIAATDARIKAAVAQTPIIEGKDTPKKASAPAGALLQAEQKRARTGEWPISPAASADAETRLALAEYHPFWHLDQIPRTAAILFVVADSNTRMKENFDAVEASKLLKGPTDVARIPGITHSQINSGAAFEAAAKVAAEWFSKHL
jgi:hypothetical protein